MDDELGMLRGQKLETGTKEFYKKYQAVYEEMITFRYRKTSNIWCF